MSDRYFVDTNILVYAHERSAGPKHVRAQQLMEELWSTGQGVLSTQVLQEFCVSVRRNATHPMRADELRGLLQDYSRWRVVINTPESILRALEIESRFRISFWDALIVQAAEEADAAVLYSEDLASGQRYGSVRVINPFV
ncbi:MAG TPA: PIN domain-containing protein [Candidatus Bathyarchaeia archaeon]|nr:PIN domain-containing protein [Candidatus Bathyarchaeia archaeon]